MRVARIARNRSVDVGEVMVWMSRPGGSILVNSQMSQV